jgi:hypothetical protein
VLHALNALPVAAQLIKECGRMQCLLLTGLAFDP